MRMKTKIEHVGRWYKMPLFCLCLLFIVFSFLPVKAEENLVQGGYGARSTARGVLLDFAGALHSRGYTVRDACVEARIEGDKHVVVEVNLLAPNKYWFCTAPSRPGDKLDIAVYDAKGNAVAKSVRVRGGDGGAVVAAGFEPPQSGKYFIKISPLNDMSCDVCLLYLYK